MLLLDGTAIVGTVEAGGAGHEPAQAEAEPDPAVEEGASDAGEWEDRDMGDWIAGTGAYLENAKAGIGADAEAEAGDGVKTHYLRRCLCPLSVVVCVD